MRLKNSEARDHRSELKPTRNKQKKNCVDVIICSLRQIRIHVQTKSVYSFFHGDKNWGG